MDNEEFVKVIMEIVREACITGSIEDLVDPPGRKPDSEDLELSSWYKQLAGDEKEKINKVISRAVDSITFGFFSVLDDVRSIESEPNKGELELYYKKDGISYLINNPQEIYLHDLFNNLTRK